MEGVKLPYLRKGELAEMMGVSRATIQQRIGEMEASGRYGPYAILRDGQIVQINVLCFIDWLRYRRFWTDKRLRKYIPEYNAENVAQAMGWKIDKVSLRRVRI